jgi:uncharacterized HAD superfamily protein
MKKTGLDIDGVICHFVKGFYEWFNTPYIEPKAWEDPFIFERFHQIIGEKYFWLELEPLINPFTIKFPVECYITARPIPSYISYLWLINNGFPSRPVFSTGKDSQRHNPKVEVIQDLNLDIFVDDKPQHFFEINKYCPNTTCYLMDAPWNQDVDAGELRLKSLAELNNIV